MAMTPISGFNGNPSLTYAGTAPVCMESPCPYACWNPIVGQQLDSTWSFSGSGDTGYAQLSENYLGSGIFGNCYLQMVHPKRTTITATLSQSGTFTSNSITLKTWVMAQTPATEYWNNTTTGSKTLSPPYYRYRIQIYVQGLFVRAAGNYVRINFTLS